MRRAQLLLTFLLLFGWAAGSPPPDVAWAHREECDDHAICGFTYEVRQVRDFGSPGREVRRCVGVVWVPSLSDRLDARDPEACYGALAAIDCAGHIVGFRLGDWSLLCAHVNRVWKQHCDPDLGSTIGPSAGACAWRDYYGAHIRLQLQVPPHRFRITPYPVGFVARTDPWGVFRPTARLVWEQPPWPQHADSGWRLWTWGSHRGPGQAPFPCSMREAELLAHGVPAGTTCLRVQLWTAPGGFQRDANGALRAVLLPGLLQFPAAGLNVEVAPGQVVEIRFPYASHPATGQVSEVDFGDRVLPAFNGYFQRGWPVRLRLEKKTVRDFSGTRTVCAPLPRARWGEMDCWTQTLQPGRRRTETYVERKEWVAEERDGVLDLTDLRREVRTGGGRIGRNPLRGR
jgi:hypothetical protein